MKKTLTISLMVFCIISISGCTSNTVITPPGGTGNGATSTEYASFYLSTGGVTTVSSAETTLVINTEETNSDSDIFYLNNNQVTVNKTTDFMIIGDCYFNTGGSSRSEYTIWLERNGEDVLGTRSGIYERGYDSGSTGTFTIITSVTSGDVFQMRIQLTDGGATTGYQDNYGTRLTFIEV